MVDFINRYKREDGKTSLEAALAAGPRRFRPILLTSITTFVGLFPLLIEKSVQAQFLIPMAISLAYGVLFATLHIAPIIRDYPAVNYSFEGEQREQRDTLSSLFKNFALALFIVYVLLAVPFKSYLQPLIIMSAIPFGFTGAVIGHIIMGMNLAILSIIGIVALSGVVVNDSLVMVDFINRYKREDGKTSLEAALAAGPRRFRPILLTSITTFVGLFPLLIEKSVQAQFLIPMAISLAYGVLFATLHIAPIIRDYPAVNYSFEGEQREQRDTLSSLFKNFALALFIVYVLLAVPFKSYLQPLIIMSAIPFGFTGAVIGHIIMGMNLAILSIIGIVALSGVVVNDSLVMVDFINRYKREDGKTSLEAALAAGPRRFRPILLTSITTFVGLFPLLIEKSVQAQFLIPMAISLAYGVLFATLHIAPIIRDYPAVNYSFEGEQREQRDTLSSLFKNFALALFIVYVLLAVPFKSYLQPLIIMSAIPFGFTGQCNYTYNRKNSQVHTHNNVTYYCTGKTKRYCRHYNKRLQVRFEWYS
jgi:multidrug efflux pump subunit AcrB